MGQTYFQKGFGLRSEVRPQLQANYRSRIVDLMRAQGFRLKIRDLTFRLANEFGFCYGVDRAVEYAYETVAKFPNRRIFLTGEIIHNPFVNNELRQSGIEFLTDKQDKYGLVTSEDVVILPAFGVPNEELDVLAKKRCIVVDTTCGSVLNVWKNVERYAANGITSIIHGKFEHEETRATYSRTSLHSGAHYLIVRSSDDAAYVCEYIVKGGSREEFLDKFRGAASDGFDPDYHLERLGLANQTTMLSSESLEIARMLRLALIRKHGEDGLNERYISFDTICSATQDRQDAMKALRREPIDLMIVIGGYNSSNTNNLARIASEFTLVYHIEDARSILNVDEIRHKVVGRMEETTTRNWIADGPQTIGLTSGASTPNTQIGEAVERIVGFRDRMDLTQLKDLIHGHQQKES